MEAKSLYISSLEQAAGGLVIVIGFMEILKKRLQKVAFFRPFVTNENDKDIAFMLEHFDIKMKKPDSYGFVVDFANKMIAQNKLDELMELILEKYKKLENEYDFVLCEGLHKSSFSATLDFDINLEIAKNLSSSFVSVLNAKNKSSEKILQELAIESKNITSRGCKLFATFVNRIDSDIKAELSDKLKNSSISSPVYLLSETKELDTPSVKEIMQNLKCTHIFGSEEELRHFVKQPKIAAMSVENFLSHTEDGDLIIVPGDRADIVLAVIASNYSKEFPSIAGMLLTGGLLPCKNVKKLINSLDSINFPIISTKNDTYKAAVDVERVSAKIYPYSYRKIALAMGIFFDNVNLDEIESRITLASPEAITPLMFKYAIFERARKNIKKIVLPESSDPRILRAADILLKRGVVELILLGNKEEILHKSASLGVDISKATIIDPLTSPLTSEFIEDFYNLRKHKGLSLDGAKDAMNHVSYFGTMLVYKGYADGMVSGAIHTTQETIRPALQIIKTKKDISIVSSVFFMCFETKVLVYGDCAVNQDPTPNELAEIAISSAATAKAFGIEPKVAMLSYSTGDSGEGVDVEKVKTATKLAKEKNPNLFIDGPIQYDAAIDKTVAKTKLPNSKVAGNATVFIFPDLNTGNNTYKAVQRSSGAIAIGPILQGLNKPVNDLSRGCSVEDIVNTVAITAIQADMQ